VLGGFDLNEDPHPGAEFNAGLQNEHANFVPGLESAISGNVPSATDETCDEIFSQLIVPYVGMIFDDLEDAQKVYNAYSWKLWFWYSYRKHKSTIQKKCPKRYSSKQVFQCVHTRKPAWESSGDGSKTKGASNILDAMIDITGFSTKETHNNQDGEQTELKEAKETTLT
jgi:hypothetical protein